MSLATILEMGLFDRPDRQPVPEARQEARACELGEIPDGSFEREQALLLSLDPLGSPGMVGSTFGPGRGLEAAVQAAAHYLPDDASLREVGMGVAQEFLLYIRINRFSFDDIDDVLGVTERRFKQNVLRKHDWWSLFSMVDEAKSLISDLARGSGETLSAWNGSSEFARRVLAYQAVAKVRFAATGIIPAD